MDPSSMCGAATPSSKTENPNPVPRVMTTSTPRPVMTPRPCISASLTTRTVIPVAFATLSAKLNPDHCLTSVGEMSVPSPRSV